MLRCIQHQPASTGDHMSQRHSLSCTKTKNGMVTPLTGSTALMRPTLLVLDRVPCGASSLHQWHCPMKWPEIKACRQTNEFCLPRRTCTRLCTNLGQLPEIPRGCIQRVEPHQLSTPFERAAVACFVQRQLPYESAQVCGGFEGLEHWIALHDCAALACRPEQLTSTGDKQRFEHDPALLPPKSGNPKGLGDAIPAFSCDAKLKQCSRLQR